MVTSLTFCTMHMLANVSLAVGIAAATRSVLIGLASCRHNWTGPCLGHKPCTPRLPPRALLLRPRHGTSGKLVQHPHMCDTEVPAFIPYEPLPRGRWEFMDQFCLLPLLAQTVLKHTVFPFTLSSPLALSTGVKSSSLITFTRFGHHPSGGFHRHVDHHHPCSFYS